MRRWWVLTVLTFVLTGCESEWTNRLPYAGPVEIGIEQGESLPGTDIEYSGKSEKGALVSIGGKPATKKIGDSLDWKGDMLRGVSVDQTLRVALITQEVLQTIGTVRVIVTNPNPQRGAVNTSASVHFKLPAGYHVEKDKPIPGTTIIYLGNTNQGAQLGNVEGYEYRKLGDSIIWEGKLREGIWLELNLRTAVITDEQLDVVGTADLWLVPSGD